MNPNLPEQGSPASKSESSISQVGQRSTASKVTVVTLAILGGIVLFGAVMSWVISAVQGGSTSDNSRQTVDVSGVTELDLNASAGIVTVLFADVDEAVLEVTGSRGEWQMEREGSELTVSSPKQGWLSSSFGLSGTKADLVELTLPSALEQESALNGSFSLAAGKLNVTGNFHDLDLSLSAGDMSVDGAAHSVEVEMSAGQLKSDLDGVETATYEISAGTIDATIRGQAPQNIEIDVSAGNLDLTLPDAEYAVESEVSVGSVDNRLKTSPASVHHIFVEVSVGQVTLVSE